MPAVLDGRLVNVPDEVDPLLCPITWADGLGAITHIEGPSDQPLTVSAGSGQVIKFLDGIDFSTLGTDEPLLKAPADAITSAVGAAVHRIPVSIGGTIYYLTAREHGT